MNYDYVSKHYDETDFRGVPENVMIAAEKFLDILRAAGGESKYNVIVPYSHLAGHLLSESCSSVGIIYEEDNQLADRIQCGYEDVMEFYNHLQEVEEKYNVLFEAYNHWSLTVYDESKKGDGPPIIGFGRFPG